jgi:myo-inositol catabolism protein IolS
MQLRQCGKYNLRLPVLGMGCWAYGGGKYWGAQNQGDVDEVVRYAADQGCCFFDAAEAYNKGASETSLGLVLQGIRLLREPGERPNEIAALR